MITGICILGMMLVLVSYFDIMVDGKFVVELKDLNLRFKGSSNQRTIKVQESLRTGEIVLWDA